MARSGPSIGAFSNQVNEITLHRDEAAKRRKKWKAECAERKLRADIAWERFKAALMRGDFAPRRKANFNPNQPRVAAGNPDGGQWTDGSGAQSRTGEAHDRATGRNDPRILSDATPDSLFKPGAQLAQDDTARRLPVDLREEEARGGHTIEKHVNRSPQALKAQVQEIFDQDPRRINVHSGSFSSIEAANKLVNSTLAQNRAIVDQVAAGLRHDAVVHAQFGSVTGIEAVGPNIRSEVYFRQTDGVGVRILHDPSSRRGYFVDTAFPSNNR